MVLYVLFIHIWANFFLAYKINIIDVREAAMFTMLFGSFLLKLITIFGCYKLSKFLFKDKYYASLFSLIVVVFPFGNKAFYDLHQRLLL